MNAPFLRIEFILKDCIKIATRCDIIHPYALTSISVCYVVIILTTLTIFIMFIVIYMKTGRSYTRYLSCKIV